MITELNRRDRISQSLMPTVMVPKHSELPPCRPGQVRFLMAEDGLYLESSSVWGGLVRKLWDNPRAHPLPYGTVIERDGFSPVLHEHIMPLIQSVILPEAAAAAENKLEWAGLIVWNGADFALWPVAFETSQLRAKCVDRGLTDLPEGYSLVADVHSHHVMPPFFSEEDNASDSSRVKMSVVLGNYRVESDRPAFDWKARYCVEGFFFNCHQEDFDATD